MNSLLLAATLAWPAAGLTPLDRELAPVVDLFYNLEFEKATAEAEAVARRHPGHPVGPFYRSIVYYQRFLAEEPRSTATLAGFERESTAAIRSAEALLHEDPATAHYYIGIARGFRGRVLAAQRRYVRAIPEGIRAVRELTKALRLDPELDDAYLGLGMYHYFTARIPAGAKPFAYLIGGGWGDREKGLEYLRRTAERGGPARMEARSMLSSIYALEGDWEKADSYLSELAARYPRNPLYRLRRVYVLERWGRWEAALAASDPSGAWLDELPPGLRDAAIGPARYRAAEILLLTGRPRQAAPLLAALERDRVGEALADFAALRRANLLDSEGRRREALDLYRSLRHKAAAALAREFIASPYPAGSRAVMPWLGLETPS